MDLKKIEGHDRVHAAVHEAGHLVVLLARGSEARAHIERSDTGATIDHRGWGGSVGLLWCDAPISACACAAGVVAECWFKNRDIEPWEIVEYLGDDWDTISKTDSDGLPDNDEELCDIVDDVLTVLEQHRRLFVWAVEELFVWQVITDGDARDAARQHGISTQS